MNDATNPPHSVFDFEVQWGDCDPAEIVYYPNYYRWFDNAAHRMFATRGFSLPEVLAQYRSLGFPLVNAEARFVRPSRVGDPVRVESRVSAMSRKTITIDHRMVRDGELLVEGREIRIFGVRTEEGALAAGVIPQPLRSAFGF